MVDSKFRSLTDGAIAEIGELLNAVLPTAGLHLALLDEHHRLVSSYSHNISVAAPAIGAPYGAILDELATRDMVHVAKSEVHSRQAAGLLLYLVAELQHAGAIENLVEIAAKYLSRSMTQHTNTESLNRAIAEQMAIMDHISDGLLVLDSSGVVQHMNVPASRMLKLEISDCLGKQLGKVLDFDLTIGDVFRTGNPYVDRELHIRSSRLDLQIMDTAIPIRNGDGTVLSVVNTFREMSRVKKLSNRMAGDRARYRFSDVLGHSRAIKDAILEGKRAARSDANLLISGESGTGKEVFAQAVHNEGRRAGSAFVAINCAALPRDLIESELFGYVSGSFTGADKVGRPGRFELASGGTIFLDEISEMPLDVQAKLLRVLQERQITRIGGAASIAIDVRVVAATNRDLKEMVAKSAFREDLYYRLDVIQINLPPLRDRREDIARLTDEFVRRSCANLHRSTISLSREALSQLTNYLWPGNIRQLQNVIERLVNLVDGDHVESIPENCLSVELPPATKSSVTEEGNFNLDALERQTILRCLEDSGYNIAKSAGALGITRPTLYAKLRKYGIRLTNQLVRGV